MMSNSDPGNKANFVEAVYSWYRSIIRNPKYRWWLIGGTLLYLLSPIDLLPDIFPVVGWIDDGIIASLLVAELSQLFLERLKTGKDSTSDAEATTQTAAKPPSSTVDVNAVKVE